MITKFASSGRRLFSVLHVPPLISPCDWQGSIITSALFPYASTDSTIRITNCPNRYPLGHRTEKIFNVPSLIHLCLREIDFICLVLLWWNVSVEIFNHYPKLVALKKYQNLFSFLTCIFIAVQNTYPTCRRPIKIFCSTRTSLLWQIFICLRKRSVCALRIKNLLNTHL